MMYDAQHDSPRVDPPLQPPLVPEVGTEPAAADRPRAFAWRTLLGFLGEGLRAKAGCVGASGVHQPRDGNTRRDSGVANKDAH